MQHDDTHELGLAHDLNILCRQTASRRGTLGWLAAGPAQALLGCGGGGGEAGSGNTRIGSDTGSGTGSTSCSVIPEETAGPYPGDGSSSSDGSVASALALSGIVRSDIRTSVGSASGTAAGVPLKLIIDLVNTNGSCADLSGYAIYLWHCDAQGRYSMHGSGATGENDLRGVQPMASDGSTTYVTVFPGCCAGRMPHIHFEV